MNVPHKILILTEENLQLPEKANLATICVTYCNAQSTCGLGAKIEKATTKPKPVRVISLIVLLAERVGTWLRSGVGAA